MIQKFIVFIGICILLISCKDVDTAYNKDGVSFTIPAGWRTGMQNKGFIECKRNGFMPYGSVLISWVDDNTDILTSLLEAKRSMDDPMTRKAINYIFTPIQSGKFGNYGGYFVNYKIKARSIISTGFIYCFYTNNKTFTITIVQMAANEKENAAAIKKIADSFRVN